MKISLIVAASENNVIGIDNGLPWHLPADMKYFKEKTLHHHVLSGRKNYESIPARFRPLPDRQNLILTHDSNYRAEGTHCFQNIQDAIAFAEKAGETELFIIGGGEIFKQCFHRANCLYLTRIHAIQQGDVFFPAVKNDEWQLVSAQRRMKDDKNVFDMSFLVFNRK